MTPPSSSNGVGGNENLRNEHSYTAYGTPYLCLLNPVV